VANIGTRLATITGFSNLKKRTWRKLRIQHINNPKPNCLDYHNCNVARSGGVVANGNRVVSIGLQSAQLGHREVLVGATSFVQSTYAIVSYIGTQLRLSAVPFKQMVKPKISAKKHLGFITENIFSEKIIGFVQ
jgi:hypothetical protein